MTADPISDIHVDWEPRAALVAMEQLRPMEELAYRRILDLIYVHGNRLIDDDRELARMTKMGSKRWPEIKRRLIDVHRKLYIDEDGHLRNKMCDKKLTKIGHLVNAKSRAGKASAAARRARVEASENNGLGSTPVGTEGPTEDQQEGQHNSNTPSTQAQQPYNPITSKKGRGAKMPPSYPHYAFTGQVIRLTTFDLERWRTAYKNIPNLEAELTSCDDYLVGKRVANSDEWFARASGWLRRSDAEYIAKLPEDRKPRTPNPQAKDLDYGPN